MKEVGKQALKAIKEQLRKDVSKANKRLQRLEGNNLEDVSAYGGAKNSKRSDKPRFSSAGDDINELQAERKRVKQFLDAETSTVRGANKNLKGLADRAGIKYDKIGELPEKTTKFYNKANKIGEYLRNKGSYHGLDYEKIWEMYSEYTEQVGFEKADSMDIEDIIDDMEQQGMGMEDDKKKDDDDDWFQV